MLCLRNNFKFILRTTPKYFFNSNPKTRPLYDSESAEEFLTNKLEALDSINWEATQSERLCNQIESVFDFDQDRLLSADSGTIKARFLDVDWKTSLFSEPQNRIPE